MTVRFLPSGDTAVVAEFGDRIDRALNQRVLRLNAAVRAAGIPGVVETLPTFRSLLVHYDPLATRNADVIAAIERLLALDETVAQSGTLWRIPACYEGTHAPDLEEVAQRAGLAADEVIRLHSGTQYQVYMIGFSPGFPYMGDVPAPLALPRRTDPRVRVPAGSIAIAAGMTAVYPVESPGGWHLIGSTPVRFFDVSAPQPALLAPGDRVLFEPVDESEYERIGAAVATGEYRMPSEAVAAT
jgi:inhibitor of KinA